jgi:pilus assembly protein Flp/PilA
MFKKLFAFMSDEEGLTTVEYAIAGGLVGAGVIGAFGLLGDAVFDVIDAIYDAVAAIVIT